MTMHGWPQIFGFWEDELPQLNRQICMRAIQDLALCEVPPSSNRSPRIDQYNTRAEAPLGSFWCASWVSAVLEDAGAAVPPTARASCDAWVDWAIKNQSWIPNEPVLRSPPIAPGFVVVYTNRKPLGDGGRLDAVHVGILLRESPYLISIEGNAAWGGSFSTNGEAVIVRRVDVQRVYGFISPRVAAG